MTDRAEGPEHADPLVARRARISRWVGIGQRIGYGAFGLAIAAFVVGTLWGFSQPLVTVVVALLVVGSAVLAPSIVFSHAVLAADRADREDDW